MDEKSTVYSVFVVALAIVYSTTLSGECQYLPLGYSQMRWPDLDICSYRNAPYTYEVNSTGRIYYL